MHEQRTRKHSQIEFNDPEAGQYRSLYLGTLGAEARCKPRPQSAGSSTSSNHVVEGYIHGTLSTAGIAGASPAVRSVSKQKAKLRDILVAKGFTPQAAADHATATSAASADPAPASGSTGRAAQACDPGMRPKIRIPGHVNKPDVTHTTLDIAGAQPSLRNKPQHPRNTNPLSPDYKLPSGALHTLPSGPAPADRLLCDPLKVSDIPGATRSPRRARSAAAPQPLDVRDIEGATTSWKPPHRHYAKLQTPNFILNVSDINTYMARFKAGPRSSPDKGHPEGPKAPQHVNPRHDPGDMDNSLRTLDIERSRPMPAAHLVRAPHCLNTSVADIEGTSPGGRDKVRLFELKKAAAAAALADHAAGEAVLSGLVLDPAELAAIWNKCSKLDKDKSGYLTAAELESSLQAAQLHLSPVDTQRLLAALKDNAGLMNYKKLTKQLKGRVSRPNSAQHQSQQQSVPATAELVNVPAAEAKPASSIECQLLQQTQLLQQAITSSSTAKRFSRPCTAPARSQQTSARAAPSHPGVSFVDTSLWFSGIGQDAAAAAEVNAWSPTHALEHALENAVLTKEAPYPVEAEDAAAAATPCAEGSRQVITSVNSTTGSSGSGHDMVPGWVIGADLVHGTFKVVQPFDHARAVACTAEAGGVVTEQPPIPAAEGQAEAAAAACSSSNGSSAGLALTQTYRQRSASAWPCTGRSNSSRYIRPVSAGYSSTGSSSIVPCDLGLSVAGRPASSSCMSMSELLPAASNAGTGAAAASHMQQASRPRSATAAHRGTSRINERCHSKIKGGGFVVGSLAATCQGSSSTIGLAERRRVQEGVQQDLAAVRLLQ